uniref:Uncharacterized protein n=1 Tax=viral metagenome TaxID=1070528 RepID=A0A6C0AY88_9ZZZZ
MYLIILYKSNIIMFYMNNYIKTEYVEFAKYHKNMINIIVHILSGILYMSSLNVLSNNRLIYWYMLLLLLTYDEYITILFSLYFIYLSTNNFTSKKITHQTCTILFLTGCFLIPEISHYATNENTVLNMNNITIDKFITNIFYFLPFSMNRFIELSNIK